MDYVNTSNIQKIRIVYGLTESFESHPEKEIFTYDIYIFFTELSVTQLIGVLVTGEPI